MRIIECKLRCSDLDQESLTGKKSEPIWMRMSFDVDKVEAIREVTDGDSDDVNESICSIFLTGGGQFTIDVSFDEMNNKLKALKK